MSEWVIIRSMTLLRNLVLCLLVILMSVSTSSAQATQSARILVFGDSITAGYGLDRDEAFPALLEKRAVAAGYAVEIVNAGLSGETSAGGVRRVAWVLKGPIDVFVLELGANDALRGLPLDQTKDNLIKIITEVRTRYPQVQVLLAGMKSLPNLGAQYGRELEEMYSAVSEQSGVPLIPFILEGVGGVPELNLPDGLHPTAAGHVIIAETVWPYLKRALDLCIQAQ